MKEYTVYKPCDSCEQRKAIVLFNGKSVCNKCRGEDNDGNPIELGG